MDALQNAQNFKGVIPDEAKRRSGISVNFNRLQINFFMLQNFSGMTIRAFCRVPI